MHLVWGLTTFFENLAMIDYGCWPLASRLASTSSRAAISAPDQGYWLVVHGNAEYFQLSHAIPKFDQQATPGPVVGIEYLGSRYEAKMKRNFWEETYSQVGIRSQELIRVSARL